MLTPHYTVRVAADGQLTLQPALPLSADQIAEQSDRFQPSLFPVEDSADNESQQTAATAPSQPSKTVTPLVVAKAPVKTAKRAATREAEKAAPKKKRFSKKN